MTTIPKRRYYVILIVLMIVSIVAFAAVLFYVREVDRQAADRDLTLNTRYAYDGCIERNQLRSIMLTDFEARLALPLLGGRVPETLAYRRLLESYLESDELRPIDCGAILEAAK